MKKALISAGITVAVVLLTFLLRGFVREGFVVPIFKLVRIAASLPQDIYWFFFLGVAAVIASRSLNRWSLPQIRARGPQTGQPGQLEHLVDLLEKAHQGVYTKERLARYLGELTLDILAYQERIDLEVVKGRLRAGTLNVPPDILAYLRAGLMWDSTYQRQKRDKHFKPETQAPPLDLNPSRMVEFLESQMEGYSDIRDR
ncbi:MAG: hypothetical protein JRG97_16270 [Deltaproteobacteria bacterium]|nr:hypothetical protein [Deltaproteobacteria bacterium]MBW2053814.1 hypothetical protein [Deltaproteobacteria bacterium]MBW2142581.1 hypothetical protein [Deltaproteobacteria bacterium]MBW2324604.1 hypothetical protein [Deltaproteobacteria bacterium]